MNPATIVYSPPAAIAGLPMYDLPELQDANDTLWVTLRGGLERRGVVRTPLSLTRTDDLYGLWSSPDLLLAQTCGYPFAAKMAHNGRLVMTPQYRAQGCEGPYHRSALVVRRRAIAQNLADLKGKTLALNAPDSNTGMNLLRVEVAVIAGGQPWFGAVVVTGGHAQSAAAVAEGRADIASIDCVTWALLQRLRPTMTASLRVLSWTSRCPGLPLITSVQTEPAVFTALGEALLELPADRATDEARRELLLDRFHVLPKAYYGSPLYLEQVATALGYPRLV